MVLFYGYRKKLWGYISMTKEEMFFAVFCIENLAERLGIGGEEAYQMLAIQSKVLDEYIIPYYDALHTQGKEYIVNDILALMKKEGFL